MTRPEHSDWNAEAIAGILHQCAATALEYYREPNIELKADDSIVTEADREIEAFLLEQFDHPEHGSYVIGEETAFGRDAAYLEAAKKAPLCWVIDPIDGTAPYSAGVPLWGTSIGLFRHGILAEGAIGVPCLGLATVTEKGRLFEVKNLCGDDLHLCPFAAVKAPLSVAGHVGISQPCAKYGTVDLPNQVFAWSSCVASYHYLLRGGLMGYLHYAKIWDMAGGMALMRNAGFVTLTESGTEFACAMEDFRFCSERKFFVEGNLFSAPSREIAEHIRTHIRAEKN